jgi:hypothetical protein
MNKGVGMRHFMNQSASTICRTIASAIGQPLPAGL